jgi:hypothetical protein
MHEEMTMSFRSATIAMTSIWMCGAVESCAVENHNGVSCLASDCASSCIDLGFPGGACVDDVCACDVSDSDAYAWDGGDGADAAPSIAERAYGDHR